MDLGNLLERNKMQLQPCITF